MGFARHGIPFSESRAVTVCNSSGLTWVDGEQGRFGNMEDTEVEHIWPLSFLPFRLSTCLLMQRVICGSRAVVNDSS